MTYPARQVVETELAMLEDMLRSIEPDRVIERESVEARRDRVRQELGRMGPEVERITLTFAGEPVEARRSILANFGGKAAELFSQAVAALDAGLEAPLGAVGPVPKSKERQLRIVGTAVGSFGFVMEPPAPQQTTLPDSTPSINPSAAAIELLREAGEGNEEAIANLLSHIPRQMSKLGRFVKYVVDNKALFSVQLGNHRAGIKSLAEGRAMLELLRDDQVEQSDITLDVLLTGVLPESHRFEAKLNDETIEGAIARDAPIKDLKNLVDSRSRMQFRVTRFRRSGRKYLLLGIENADT